MSDTAERMALAADRFDLAVREFARLTVAFGEAVAKMPRAPEPEVVPPAEPEPDEARQRWAHIESEVNRALFGAFHESIEKLVDSILRDDPQGIYIAKQRIAKQIEDLTLRLHSLEFRGLG